ncbi:ATP-binding protein [Paenarthrobacter aurescens]|uniref:ATP-binding protein n=1 Tax=Paenarthrobacter aurescens TaxID=43663 RepID=UPI0035EA8D94
MARFRQAVRSGDQVVASARIDRIIHQVEVITFKDSSYRLKQTQVDSLPSTRAEAGAEQSAPKWLTLQPARQLTLRPAPHRDTGREASESVFG